MIKISNKFSLKERIQSPNVNRLKMDGGRKIQKINKIDLL
jgi:hypothetical protein